MHLKVLDLLGHRVKKTFQWCNWTPVTLRPRSDKKIVLPLKQTYSSPAGQTASWIFKPATLSSPVFSWAELTGWLSGRVTCLVFDYLSRYDQASAKAANYDSKQSSLGAFVDITSCLIVDVIPDHVCASSQKRAWARTPRPLVWDTEIETETPGLGCQQGPNLPASENVVIECGGKYLTPPGANNSVSGPENCQSFCESP